MNTEAKTESVRPRGKTARVSLILPLKLRRSVEQMAASECRTLTGQFEVLIKSGIEARAKESAAA